jgi:hypothetical protein
MAWKDVEKGSAWNFEEKNEFEGTYLGFEENVTLVQDSIFCEMSG